MTAAPRHGTINVDFLAPEVVADPFPVYRSIRAMGPCVRNDLAAVWMVTGYDDAVSIFDDPVRYSSSVLADDTFGPWYRGSTTMLGSDPPDHTRLRSVVQRSFTGKAVRERAPGIARIVDRLVRADVFRSSGPIDVLSVLALPLPALVTADLLGVPGEDADLITGWTQEMVVGSVAAVMAESDAAAAETYARAVDAGLHLADYVGDHLRGPRARAPGTVTESLLSAVDGGRIGRGEAVATCVLLLLAATETTAKLIANAVVLLAGHPDQRAAMAADPSLIRPAVEEVLRFSGPAQFDPRLVTVATHLHGQELAAGDVVWVLSAAAGRDPTRFPRPDDFDVARSPNPHLGFGHGVHLCLGAPLARLEAYSAIAALLRAAPQYAVDTVDYGTAFFIRGPVRLQVTTHA